MNKPLKKIGFIDYFLDEWHANNYPQWISGQRDDYQVAYAWAARDKEGGMTSVQWCEKHNVELLGSAREVIEKSDCIVVLSPDYPEQHEALADEALRSGKPLYVDKTFAPSLSAARSMAAIAREHSTPLFSTSALRCAKELSGINADAELIVTTGPGAFSNYAIHQVEMIVALLGTGARRIIQTGTATCPVLSIEYDSKRAVMTQNNALPFSVMAVPQHAAAVSVGDDFFIAFIKDMLDFFDGVPGAGAPIGQTLQVAAILDAAREAIARPGEWVEIEGV